MSTRRKTTATTGTKSTTSPRKSTKAPVSSTPRSSTRSSTGKTASTAAKSAASKPASSAAKATVVTDTTPTTTAPMMKKKELLNLVVERSGVRKKYAKPTVEAMMAVLGEAISEGRDLNLPPMGKIKQQRTKDASNVRVTVAKIRQNKPGTGAASDRAESGEEKPKPGVAEAAE